MKEYEVKVIVAYSDILTVRANNDDEAKSKARDVVEDPEYESHFDIFESETYEIISSKEIDTIRIELEQSYLASNDATIIWEYTYKGDDIIRERIVGYQHGEPTKEDMKKYAFGGVEGIIDLDDIYK